MSAFLPLPEAPLEPIRPSEALDLIAGVSSSDPYDARAYVFEDGSSTGPATEAAQRQFFGWLSDGNLVGAIELSDGRWQRVSLEWIRSFRRIERSWDLPTDDDGKKELVERTEMVIERLPNQVIGTGDPQVEGLAWFVDKQSLLDCKDGLTGLTGDDRLVALMRVGVARGKYRNISKASVSVAATAPGGGTLESRAQRLRRLEVRTRPNS